MRFKKFGKLFPYWLIIFEFHTILALLSQDKSLTASVIFNLLPDDNYDYDIAIPFETQYLFVTGYQAEDVGI